MIIKWNFIPEHLFIKMRTQSAPPVCRPKVAEWRVCVRATMIETVGWWLTDLSALGLIESNVRRCGSVILDEKRWLHPSDWLLRHHAAYILPSICRSATNLRQCGKKLSEGDARMADCFSHDMFATHTIALISHYFIRCVANGEMKQDTWRVVFHRCRRQNFMAAHSQCFNLENRIKWNKWIKLKSFCGIRGRKKKNQESMQLWKVKKIEFQFYFSQKFHLFWALRGNDMITGSTSKNNDCVKWFSA